MKYLLNIEGVIRIEHYTKDDIGTLAILSRIQELVKAGIDFEVMERAY